jgi:DNA repair exonuclease SbcCD ATPase subunit
MEIAHGEINIGLDDKATPELRRIEAEYKASMARIDRMEASAKIKADTSEIERKLKEARDRVRQLEGERATVTVKAEKKQLDAALNEARAAVKRLDGKKATIEIETRGAEVALAKIEALTKAEAARAKADEARPTSMRRGRPSASRRCATTSFA